MDNQIKLNLGCGDIIIPDYINVDLYNVNADAMCDVKHLLFTDNFADLIYASHIIEHFDFHEGNNVLKEWYRVLKKGGKLIIETPDFLNSCKRFVNDPAFRIQLYGHFFSTPWEPGQTHKFLFTEEQLACNLGWAGFKNMKRIMPMSNYVSNNTVDIFLAIICEK